jgi:hypothetical protein
MQAEASRPEPQLLLHGCQMSRLLQDHNSVQPCPDCSVMRWMLDGPLSTDRGQGPTH